MRGADLTFRPIDSWPGERTSRPTPSNFEASWESTLELLDREVAKLQGRNRARDIVVQLAVPEGAIRQDGKIAAGRKAPEHDGVIVSFDTPDGPMRFSCDRFTGRSWRPTLDGWQNNVRAIALALEALRKVDRYGIGQGREQYRGYQAIGSGRAMGPDDDLTLDQAVRLLADAVAPEQVDLTTPAGAHAAWRLAARTAHPDAGGDPTTFRRLTAARDLIVGSLA